MIRKLLAVISSMLAVTSAWLAFERGVHHYDTSLGNSWTEFTLLQGIARVRFIELEDSQELELFRDAVVLPDVPGAQIPPNDGRRPEVMIVTTMAAHLGASEYKFHGQWRAPAEAFFALALDRWQEVSTAPLACGNVSEAPFVIHPPMTILAFPIWLPGIAFAAFPCLLLLKRIRRAKRTRAGFCPSCGYNLTGNVTGTCSECGASIRRPDAPAPEETPVP